MHGECISASSPRLYDWQPELDCPCFHSSAAYVGMSPLLFPLVSHAL